MANDKLPPDKTGRRFFRFRTGQRADVQSVGRFKAGNIVVFDAGDDTKYVGKIKKVYVSTTPSYKVSFGKDSDGQPIERAIFEDQLSAFDYKDLDGRQFRISGLASAPVVQEVRLLADGSYEALADVVDPASKGVAGGITLRPLSPPVKLGDWRPRVVHINGMGVKPSAAVRGGLALQAAVGCDVLLVYSYTRENGDLASCVRAKGQFSNCAAQQAMAAVMRRAIAENRRLVVSAHSRGTIKTDNAILEVVAACGREAFEQAILPIFAGNAVFRPAHVTMHSFVGNADGVCISCGHYAAAPHARVTLHRVPGGHNYGKFYAAEVGRIAALDILNDAQPEAEQQPAPKGVKFKLPDKVAPVAMGVESCSSSYVPPSDAEADALLRELRTLTQRLGIDNSQLGQVDPLLTRARQLADGLLAGNARIAQINLAMQNLVAAWNDWNQQGLAA